MAGAAPAFSYNYPERRPERPQRPPVRVVPGRRTVTQTQGVPSAVILLAKIAAVVLVLGSLLCFARIGLASAAVTTSLESQQLSSQISNARSGGNNLEVVQSSLSNPTHVKTEASRLEMVAPETVGTITLGTDVVAVDSQGDLSLSESMRIAAGIQE